jgi:hypothetical protein
MRVGFWIPNDKSLFDSLLEHKNEIEQSIGQTLDWDRLEGKKACVISASIPGLNFNKQDNYPELMNKAIDMVLSFRDAFKPFI